LCSGKEEARKERKETQGEKKGKFFPQGEVVFFNKRKKKRGEISHRCHFQKREGPL